VQKWGYGGQPVISEPYQRRGHTFLNEDEMVQPSMAKGRIGKNACKSK